ncbi:MAG: hypothetical protein AAFO06_13370 [Cyanobacteria bacterium J06597_16]
MRKIQWIIQNKSHHAVIASPEGYINLAATQDAYIVQFVGDDGEDVVYSSSAKNLNDAKRLSVAFGHALLKDSNNTKKPLFRTS